MISKITFKRKGKNYLVNPQISFDLSIPLRDGLGNPNCFYAPMPEFSPVRDGDFVGSTAEGGVVNFFNIKLNPHGNGTHTECVGHITKERYVLRECLTEFLFFAKLVSIYPEKQENGDRVITLEQIKSVLKKGETEAFVLRTLPNYDTKKQRQYSGTNPPYIAADALKFMANCGVQHLLLDLPSVDREEDGGKLAAHRVFWQYPKNTRMGCTITEMIFAPDVVEDNFYLLNLQTLNLDLDASPSRAVIWGLE